MWSGWRNAAAQQFNIDVPLDEDPLPAHPVRVEEQSEQSRESVKKAKGKAAFQAAAGPQAGSDLAPAADEKKPAEKKQRRNRRCWTIW